MVPPMPGSTLWGWAGPLLVTALGAFLRFYRLGQPPAVLFDETYYVPDAYGILKHGVEIDHVHNVNALLAHVPRERLLTAKPGATRPLPWRARKDPAPRPADP